jgi:hypothetical protein
LINAILDKLQSLWTYCLILRFTDKNFELNVFEAVNTLKSNSSLWVQSEIKSTNHTALSLERNLATLPCSVLIIWTTTCLNQQSLEDSWMVGSHLIQLPWVELFVMDWVASLS